MSFSFSLRGNMIHDVNLIRNFYNNCTKLARYNDTNDYFVSGDTVNKMLYWVVRVSLNSSLNWIDSFASSTLLNTWITLDFPILLHLSWNNLSFVFYPLIYYKKKKIKGLVNNKVFYIQFKNYSPIRKYCWKQIK